MAASLRQQWKADSLLELARAANAVPPPNFAALFHCVAGSQDPLAQDVLRRAGSELADIASVVIGQLFANDPNDPVPVAMTGGVFRHSEIVREVFYNELRRLDRRAEVNPRIVDPVEGALRLARQAASNRG